jgi:hypothetical protein
MKTITRSNIYLPMAAMILTAALAVPAAAQKQVPFKGVIQGQDLDIGGPDTAFVVRTTGTGTGSHLGQFSFTLEITLNALVGTDTGSACFTAANGDIIYATFAGSSEVIATPDGIAFMITETYTVSGGTGRFAGAQGSFRMDRVASPVTFTTSGSFHGTITSPGAAH